VNRSTRSALLAPAVVLLAMAGGPAQAGTAGLMARCSTTADSVVHGITTITGGKVGDSPVPLSPVADYKLPLTEPGLGLTLNKQVKDPFGGMTASAASLESVPGGIGPVRDFAVTHCAVPGKAAHGLRRGGPVTSQLGGLLQPAGLRSVLGGLVPGGPSALFGGLPGLGGALPQPG
jgi:hypothetical protein